MVKKFIDIFFFFEWPRLSFISQFPLRGLQMVTLKLIFLCRNNIVTTIYFYLFYLTKPNMTGLKCDLRNLIARAVLYRNVKFKMHLF
jgi:hypothetical protein